MADRRSIRLIMAALVAAILLASLDGMIFNTALPTIVGRCTASPACRG